MNAMTAGPADDGATYGLLEGTNVMTLRGAMPVEALEPGDRVITRSGALALERVAMRREAAPRMVRVAASALATDRPDADIVMTADQPILVRDWRAPAMAGQPQALMAAGRMADGEYIRPEPMDEARLYTLHFAVPAVIYAHGLELACAPVAAVAVVAA
ncbi:MAG TPA: Hint domain-containing protein [Paracoccaceae bacterium]|nr:Hint domain-containing protein [Paracoccaceae bacterium]